MCPNKKLIKIIKDLYKAGELDKIINMTDDQMKTVFNDEDLFEFERKMAQQYKDDLDLLTSQTDIEKMSFIPLLIDCKSVLFLQSIICKMIERG